MSVLRPVLGQLSDNRSVMIDPEHHLRTDFCQMLGILFFFINKVFFLHFLLINNIYLLISRSQLGEQGRIITLRSPS